MTLLTVRELLKRPHYGHRTLLAVLDHLAYEFHSGEASVNTDSGVLTCTYHGWSDTQPAFRYTLAGKPVDAEAASRAIEGARS